MNDRIDFNTGRGYTDHGQRITAIIVATAKDDFLADLGIDEDIHLVHVIDHDRGLDDLYVIDSLTQDKVMDAYDRSAVIAMGEIRDTFDLDGGDVFVEAIQRRQEVEYNG